MISAAAYGGDEQLQAGLRRVNFTNAILLDCNLGAGDLVCRFSARLPGVEQPHDSSVSLRLFLLLTVERCRSPIGPAGAILLAATYATVNHS